MTDQLTGQRFIAELRDAVAPRAVALVVGVLGIQLLFIASYVAAFHRPTPHRVPVEVAAPAGLAAPTAARLDRLPGHPLQAQVAPNAAAALGAVRNARADGALVVDPASGEDTVAVASGGGAALSGAVEAVLGAVEAAGHRRFEVRDLVPLQPGDHAGLTGFYLVIGWIVGGYLVASLLGVAAGSRPATTRRAIIRLLAIAPYAVVSGFGGALVVDQWIGALTGHFLALAGVGMLLVYAAAATTLAFQVLLGVVGIGVTVLVFVVAGNPSAGGAYQPDLLPGFFRAISGVLPNGAGVDAVRRIVYFAGLGVTADLLVISAWVVGGSAVAIVASLRHDRAAARSGDRAAPPVV
jgi:hypothetical protein